MQELNVFPAGTALKETLSFYLKCCSIQLDAQALSAAAATLAGGGRNPVTGERVVSAASVRRCLAMMATCGMYDSSGEFAFAVGLPAKSGVSGALMVVIPQVMGVCVWSPRLDGRGNSVRGVEFCRELVSRFAFHMYDIPGEGDH
ncbi:glutaminase [Streptomyces sp. NEAU-YJ-81]|uniref:glutaminase n=1 Tax=Streptomyces sp. NEAU-YJ-81 TaxID=2820288 RepID=UPI001ABD00CA|nr:glutaminase [Streptomyces sp. NEAU-YJ-81]MBO3676173.1 glutaminase [Streptomyces sp. NEAU-YJ-81]